MSRTILIVDDIEVNRLILQDMLSEDYSVLTASGGRQALELLSGGEPPISALLLDINMPDMDGFQVLSRIRGEAKFSALPVIMITAASDEESRVKFLSMGANDYVTSPYNADVVRHCLRNQIAFSEASATLMALQRDALTGIYNKDVFFDKAAQLIQTQPEGFYMLSCLDINSFKVVNDQYGRQKGDQVLKTLAQVLLDYSRENGALCGRISSDNFALLRHRDARVTGDEPERLGQAVFSASGVHVTVGVGRYPVDDKSLTVSAMYDRARIALDTVKGRFDLHAATFDESMRARVLREQEIVTEMSAALNGGQFEAWFQPQYNHSTGALVGAEALARWRHPVKGLIPPDVFIPIFEENGFIYALDKYIWEESCRCIRRWLDQGQSPLPVSVNVSRLDILHDDIADVLTGLVEKYRLSLNMLRLEVTETAFSNDQSRVISMVKRLIEKGFIVEIDDFGSGYSSLNTLKDVPAQILKLDMKFLHSSDSQRGGNIVESVVRMAKWLGMSVIAEGVETIEQADFLRSIGCFYVQGYYFAKPMPAAEYELHCRDARCEERLLSMETVEHLDNNRLWDPDSMDSLIFNSFVGGACIFELHDGVSEILRSTDTFVSMLGEGMQADSLLKLDLLKYLDENCRASFLAAVDESAAEKKQVSIELIFTELPGCPRTIFLRTALRVIAAVERRLLVYAANENITAQRQAEQQLRSIMENINSGITAVVVAQGVDRPLFANDRYFSLLGLDRADFEPGNKSWLKTVHPEDRHIIMATSEAVSITGKPASVEYRVVLPDGRQRWLRSNVAQMDYPGVDGPVQLSVTSDITESEKSQRDLLDNLPGGAGIYELREGRMGLIYQNKSYWELVGLGDIAYPDPTPMSAVHPDDIPLIMQELGAAMAQQRDVACDIRLRHLTRGYFPVHLAGRIVQSEPDCFLIYATFTPLDSVALANRKTLTLLLSAIMGSSSDFIFAKDRELRYICCSPAVLRLAGLEEEKDIRGKTDYEVFSEDMAEQFRLNDVALLAGGEPLVDFEESIHTPDGDEHHCRASKYILRDAEGEVIGLYGISRDVTKERAALEQLRLVNNSLPGGLAVLNFRGEHISINYCNDGFLAIFNGTRQGLDSRDSIRLTDWVLKEDRPLLRKKNREMLETGAESDCILRVHTLGGGVRRISYRAAISQRNGDSATANVVLLDISEQYRTLEQLRMSQEESKLALEHAGNIVCRYSVAERGLSMDPAVARANSLPERLGDVPKAQVRAGMISPETAGAYSAFFEDIDRGGHKGSVLFRLLTLGRWRWMEAHSSTIFSDDGKPVRAIISMFDVTERMEKETVYRKWLQSLEDMPPQSHTLYRLDLNSGGSFESKEGELITFDFGGGDMGIDQRSRLYANSCVLEEDREEYIAFVSRDSMLAGYYSGVRSKSLEYRELITQDSLRWLRLTIDLVENPDSGDIEAFLLYEDIDTAKRVELQTKELSESDPLTGILNRNAFIQRVDHILRSAGKGVKHALLMLDIDGFKRVNDVFGHNTGDEALIEIAMALKAAVRGHDLVARLGGDEFVVFMADINDEKTAVIKAEKICALVRRSFSMEVQISGSVGVVVAPQDGEDFATLYRKADAALYYVKGTGKNNVAVYAQSMDDQHLLPEADAAMDELKKQDKKRRMLIVDDNSIDHAMLKNIFENEFIIEKARDGNSALIRLRHYGGAISVVLLDLMMPGMDGFAVLAAMQRSEELRSIPVIIVSGDDSRDSCMRAIRAGATDFVTKPVDAEVLRIRVRSAVSRAENERLRAKNSMLELQNAQRGQFDMMLENAGVAFVEYDWHTGVFAYHPSISLFLAGSYDERPLWHILLSDMVADTRTVQEMQYLVHQVAESREETSGSMLVKLRTPARIVHNFRMNVRKKVDEFQLTSKIFISLTDTDFDP